jgi:hypothetical protein
MRKLVLWASYPPVDVPVLNVPQLIGLVLPDELGVNKRVVRPLSVTTG